MLKPAKEPLQGRNAGHCSGSCAVGSASGMKGSGQPPPKKGAKRPS